MRDRLKTLFLERAVKFGRFTLASGKESGYYVNSKDVLFHPEALSLLGELLADAVTDARPQAVGGLEVGAIPLTAAVLLAGHRRGSSLEGFFVRKQPKGHGSKQLVEGRVTAGDRVAILDDVLTTGGSALQAVKAVEAVGATVVRVVCICDRLQGATATLTGYDFRPLFTVRDFGIDPDQP